MDNSSGGPFKLISTGIEELDIKLGGGIPTPSLILIEGDHGTGKSVLAIMIASVLLKEIENSLLYITTETTVKELISKAETLNIRSFRKYFISGKLRIYSVHIAGANWAESIGRKALKMLAKYFASYSDRYDAYVLDSASILMTYSTKNDTLNAITIMRKLVGMGKTIIFTVHPQASDESIMLRLRANADVYFKLDIADVAGKAYKVLGIKKTMGVTTPPDSSIVFDIDPSIGFKVVPISLSSV